MRSDVSEMQGLNELVLLLLNHGADANLPYSSDKSFLNVAVERCSREVVKSLLESCGIQAVSSRTSTDVIAVAKKDSSFESIA